MRGMNHWLSVGLGVLLGVAGTSLWMGNGKTVLAANGDRFEDYVMCTGAASPNGKIPLDGVWLLDYRTGKLLGTVIDRGTGKIVGFAEMDLVAEFNLQPRQNVHFLMTTGNTGPGQSALYISETTTGKLGVYSLSTAGNGQQAVQIRRHDLVPFRKAN